MYIGSFPPIHSIEKSPQKSHSTWRAKRATFTIWVGKNALKVPKIVHFGDFPTMCVFFYLTLSAVIFFLFSWHGCLFSPRRMRRMSGWKDAAKHLSPFISLHRFSSASRRVTAAATLMSSAPTPSNDNTSQCLNFTEKISFNMASEASSVDIFEWPKFPSKGPK